MKLRRLLVPLAAVLLVTPALPSDAAPARAVSSVTFKGVGYGHGVGLSQYGARNRANAGQGWKKIVKHYYPKTKLRNASGKVRVLISADTSTDVVVQAAAGLSVRSLGAKHTWKLPAKRAGKKVQRWRITPAAGGERSKIAYRTGSWHQWKRPSGDAQFVGGGRPITLVTPAGRASYRSVLRSATSGTSGSDRVTVNVLPLEAYLRGVVAQEVPGEWPAAAVRAQAVAARTYAAYERAHAPSTRAYDLCDTTACQVYAGVAGEYSKADAAVRATAKRVVSYRGEPAFTQFSSSNGGWSAAGAFPYLPAKKDSFDHGDPKDPWTVTFTADEITRNWSGLGDLESVTVTESDGHGPAGYRGGRALEVRIVGSDSSVTATGAQLMSYLGLRSTLFRIT